MCLSLEGGKQQCLL
jgi:hypothetical protein